MRTEVAKRNESTRDERTDDQVMDRIQRADLKQLVESRQGPCVSLFMPMHVADRNAMEDPVRLRGLADEAEKKLIDRGMRRDEASKLLAPARDLVQDYQGWQHRGRSLAFFAAPGFSRRTRDARRPQHLRTLGRDRAGT